MTTTAPESTARDPFRSGPLAVSLLFAGTGLLASGCDSTVLASNPPFVSASAKTIDFGDVKVGHMEERTIYLINQGTQSLTFKAPEGNTFGTAFAVLLDEFIAAPKASVVARVVFEPSDVMPYATEITIPNDSSNDPKLLLTIVGVGIDPGPCDNVNCTRAPSPFCVTGTVSRHYQPMGVCVEGTCQHQYRDESCAYGCEQTAGTCKSDPCLGMACNTPPSPCFFASGVCTNGACVYQPNNAGNCTDSNACTTGDHCEEGNCVGTPVVCDMPPAPLCLAGDIRRTFDAQGVCTSSTGCTYREHDQPCGFGCDIATGCGGDPCVGVTCNTPPGQCFDSSGSCAGGGCTYPTRPGACDDGDGCTTGDTCTNGACAGTQVACTTPPAADCSGPGTVRTYSAAGAACTGGGCQYPTSVRSCDDGNACTTGDSCSNGACVTTGLLNCDDGNACTTDSCDPVVGCRHVPTSGNACVTGSGECPTGMCSAGTCLAVPNINCQAQYSVCFGLQDIDVPGRCAASGQCVVTQPPPQFICPGCNGLCIQCFSAQLCIPF